jgi:F-type H+-transporting ATPase subunit gamma
LSGSADVEKKIRVFNDIGDIIDAMKAYAGVAMRKSEALIANVREYERNVLLALDEVISADPGITLVEQKGAKRLVVAFGSSQGLCGAYNDKLADALGAALGSADALFVIGRRLKSALESRKISPVLYQDSIAGVSGIDPALRECVSRVMELYENREYYTLTLVFCAITEKHAEIAVERILPPRMGEAHSATALRASSLTHLETGVLFNGLMEQLIGISIYRGFVESVRSENWYRLRSMEGASENIERHISELESLRKYLRQEEITGEMLEILGSGGFFRR